jgi:hypothetical protein
MTNWKLGLRGPVDGPETNGPRCSPRPVRSFVCSSAPLRSCAGLRGRGQGSAGRPTATAQRRGREAAPVGASYRIGQQEAGAHGPITPSTTASEVKPSVRECTPSATSAAEPIRRPTRIRWTASSSLPADPISAVARTQPRFVNGCGSRNRRIDSPGQHRRQSDQRHDDSPARSWTLASDLPRRWSARPPGRAARAVECLQRGRGGRQARSSPLPWNLSGPKTFGATAMLPVLKCTVRPSSRSISPVSMTKDSEAGVERRFAVQRYALQPEVRVCRFW